MKAYVKANEGFRSREMTMIEAVQYAAILEKLGNYNVSVVPA